MPLLRSLESWFDRFSTNISLLRSLLKTETEDVRRETRRTVPETGALPKFPFVCGNSIFGWGALLLLIHHFGVNHAFVLLLVGLRRFALRLAARTLAAFLTGTASPLLR